MNSFYSQLIQKLESRNVSPWKESPGSLEQTWLNPNLISSQVLRLPLRIWDQAQAIVSELEKIRQQSPLLSHYHSPCMSVDCHMDSAGDLRIIEINTNAAFLAMSGVLYSVQGLPMHPKAEFHFDSIVELFLESFSEFSHNSTTQEPRTAGGIMQKPKKIVILDENPKEQNYFLEFLLYKSLFENHGIQTEIFDMDEFHSLWTKNSPHIPLENILVYNRSTDFFLTGATHSRDWLRRSFEEKNLCLVPNPWEYEVLAHKTNLIEWSKRGFLHPYLPMAAVLTSDNAAEIWKTRKQWFFKDQAAFGGKRAYSGATLTRSKFEELVSLSTSMVQEIVPAAKFQIESLAGEDNLFKSDLRFYFYKNRLLTGVGRLYQGQVTNFRTPGGGFCALQFS